MFNFSFSEILLVAIVALVFLGPKQLAIIAHRVGTWIKQGRDFMEKIKAEFPDPEKEQKLAENELRAKAADEHYE